MENFSGLFKFASRFDLQYLKFNTYNSRAERNCDGQRLPSDASYGGSNFRSSDLFAPQARARRLSGGSARPFAPPSLYYLIVSHATVRLNARVLGFIYRRRERKGSLAAMKQGQRPQRNIYLPQAERSSAPNCSSKPLRGS